MSDLNHHNDRIARARAIIDAYGARPELWPDDERDAVAQAIATHAELQAGFDEAARLDALLLAHEQETRPATESNEQLRARILAQTLPRRRWPLLLPLAAAASFSAFVLLSQVAPLGHAPETRIHAAFDRWAWEEVLDEAQPDSNDDLNGGELMELAMMDYEDVF